MAFDFPSPATSGQTVTGPNGSVWMFDGVKWLASGITQSAIVIESDTPPVNPPVGTLWWDSFGGNLYIWYQDPNTSQWVIANEGGIADAPTDGNQYARQNQSWTNISTVSAAAPNNTGRNLIHNPGFTVAQRGTGPWTANGNYTADRWAIGLASADVVSVALQAASDAQRTAIGDEAALYIPQITVTGSASGYTFLYQKIEKIQRLSGKTLTLSFWAAANTAGLRVGINYEQEFGTGGSPSSPLSGAAGQAVTLSPTWARYSVSIAMPSAIGKTFGTNGDDCTRMELWLSAGTAIAARAGVGQQSGIVYLWGIQLEIGSVMTPLAKRDPADELALCQRFYQTGGNGALSLQGYTQSGVGVGVTGLWPVQFRAVPTLTINWGNAGSVTSPSFTATTSSWFIGGNGSGSGGFILNSSGFTASADL